ncbi:unnamed protein product, partial [Musa acuminata subsp. burmannicoides]
PWSVFQDGSDGEPTSRCLGYACTPRGTPMARVMSSTASMVSPRTNDPSGLRPSMQPASIRTPS